MKRRIVWFIFSACSLMLVSSTAATQENRQTAPTKEVYTGTIINMSGRTVSTGFSLTVQSRTSDEEAQRYLSILASGGADDLLKAVRKNTLGWIAATGQTRRDLLVVRDSQIEGKGRRLIVAFERWLRFGELRAGTRSLDYAFSIMEIYFDQKGRGTGTFIGLAQPKLVRDKKTEQVRLELESFGSFPAKVMGVMRRK